jgi:hypothetical protein
MATVPAHSNQCATAVFTGNTQLRNMLVYGPVGMKQPTSFSCLATLLDDWPFVFSAEELHSRGWGCAATTQPTWLDVVVAFKPAACTISSNRCCCADQQMHVAQLSSESCLLPR